MVMKNAHDELPDTQREPAASRRRSGTRAVVRVTTADATPTNASSLYDAAEACGTLASVLRMVQGVAARPCLPARVRDALPNLGDAHDVAIKEMKDLYAAARAAEE